MRNSPSSQLKSVDDFLPFIRIDGILERKSANKAQRSELKIEEIKTHYYIYIVRLAFSSLASRNNQFLLCFLVERVLVEDRIFVAWKWHRYLKWPSNWQESPEMLLSNDRADFLTFIPITFLEELFFEINCNRFFIVISRVTNI